MSVIMETTGSIEKLAQDQDVVDANSTQEGSDESKRNWAYLKHYFTSREGWIGDYVPVLSSYPSTRLTKTGLPLFDHTQHLAFEPQIQRL